MLSTVSTSVYVTIELEKSCLASISIAVQFKHQEFEECMNVMTPVHGHRCKNNCVLYMFKCLFLFGSSHVVGKTYYLTICTVNILESKRARVNSIASSIKMTLLKNFSKNKQYNCEEYS
jgi:hypothetical protein